MGHHEMSPVFLMKSPMSLGAGVALMLPLRSPTARNREPEEWRNERSNRDPC
jgi:hypothetical protein